MKKTTLTALFISLTSALPLVIASTSSATPVTLGSVTDSYIGGNAHNLGDVIGPQTTFNISQMNASLDGTRLTVNVSTSFAGLGDDKLYAGYTYSGMGIGYGDLFLSNDWDPFGVSPYLLDNAANGTNWSYGFALDNRYSATGGSGILYKLGGDNSDILQAEDFVKNATFRNGQAVAVDTSMVTMADQISTGSWSVNKTSNLLSFTFDIAGTSLWGGTELALHYGHTCGNDVIEGAVSAPAPVPEPATMLLLGTGLAGLGGLTRRKHSS